jgi:DNA topoisomerase-3
VSNTTLYLCEKPSQARILATLLGATTKINGGFTSSESIVTYSFGHMMDLAFPDFYLGIRKWELNDLPLLPDKWEWQVNSSSKDQFEIIGKLLKLANRVVIATDPDDEGEVAGRQILLAHQYSGQIQRLWASALNNDALQHALHNLLPLTATESYYQAGLIRKKIDWLYGMNLSRAFSIHTGKTVHIGRIKTRLLHTIVEHAKDIQAFIPSPITRASINIEETRFIHNFDNPSDVSLLNKIESLIEGVCVSVNEEEISIPPPLPYNLSSLLIDAFNEYGLPIAVGYSAAQALYESQVISYPRTASTKLPSETSEFAAHHAITLVQSFCPPWLDEPAQQIFSLIHRRSDMNFFGPANLIQTKMVFNFGGLEFEALFLSENKEGDAGWINTSSGRYGYQFNKNLKKYHLGRKCHSPVIIEHGFSKPPFHFSEGTLLEYMAKNNIGTEATRVAAISSLYQLNLVNQNPSELIPSEVGYKLESSIPETIKNNTMNFNIAKAVSAARSLSNTAQTHLIEAAIWLATIINPLIYPHNDGKH